MNEQAKIAAATAACAHLIAGNCLEVVERYIAGEIPCRNMCDWFCVDEVYACACALAADDRSITPTRERVLHYASEALGYEAAAAFSGPDAPSASEEAFWSAQKDFYDEMGERGGLT